MPGEKHQQIDPKNKGIEKYLERSADRGVSLGKKLDKEVAIDAGIDIFQREKKLHEDILQAMKREEISRLDFKILAHRVFEHNSDGGWDLLKKDNYCNGDSVLYLILSNRFDHFKHKKLFIEIRNSLNHRLQKLKSKESEIAQRVLLEIENDAKRWKEQKENKSELNVPGMTSYSRLFGNQRSLELLFKIDAHYEEYIQLKKVKTLDYIDPRSAAVTLAESTLQEFFTPETEPQKVNHSVGVNINSGKKRAKQLRLLRRILDETLNDPEQNWREKQQEFAREVAIDGLQKEIKKSLEKTYPEARLEFDGKEGEFAIKDEGAKIIDEKKLDGEVFTEVVSLKRLQQNRKNKNTIFSVGRGLSIISDVPAADFRNIITRKAGASRMAIIGVNYFNANQDENKWKEIKLLRDEFSKQRIDRDDIQHFQEKKIELIEKVFSEPQDNIWYLNSDYFEFLLGIDLNEQATVLDLNDSQIQFFKEDRNQANLLFISSDGEKKNLYCEGKGVVVENILESYNKGAFIDGSWARYVRLADGRWAIYHDRDNFNDCLKIIPKNLIPVGEIYKPINKMVFVAHELDENGQSTGSVIVNENGTKISQKHNNIDFKGEYIFGEYIYIKKNDPQFNPDGPEEIWSEFSGSLIKENCSIRKIWGIQDKVYWVNARNEMHCLTVGGTDKKEKINDYAGRETDTDLVLRLTKDGVNDRIVYPINIARAGESEEIVLCVVDWRGGGRFVMDKTFSDILKIESFQEKCLVVFKEKDKTKIYIEGVGDVGGEWDKIYFLKEYENQLLICGRRGDEIVEVAVDLDKKVGLSQEEATKLKLLNLLKKYDWLAHEERSVRRKQSNTYSKTGKEKLAEKSDKLKNEREELKKKILDYFENDSAMREIWQKWDPKKDYRSHSENFADKITKIVRTSPELFLDYFRAKKDRNVEKLAKEMVDFVFNEEEEKLRKEPAKKDHWAKELAKDIVSRLLGEKATEGIKNWLGGKTKRISEQPNLGDFFYDQENVQILGGDPEEKGPGLELMRFGREYKGFICDQILGKCDDGKHWSKIDFPATFLLTEPTKETTVTINVDKKWDKIILPKPVQAAIISSRIKGITSKGKEISLEKVERPMSLAKERLFLIPKMILLN